MGCSVTLASNNIDTFWFAAAIELDGTIRESFPFGDGRELFDTGLKYLNEPYVDCIDSQRTHEELKFSSSIFS